MYSHVNAPTDILLYLIQFKNHAYAPVMRGLQGTDPVGGCPRASQRVRLVVT